MDERTRRQEKLKNAIIVVLFLTTILLLNWTWRSVGFGTFRLSAVLDLISPDVWVPEADEFIAAESSVRGFGDGTFSIDTASAAQNLENILALYRTGVGPDFLLQNEVTDEKFREMLMRYRSLRVNLSCGVPLTEYFERQGIKLSSGFEQIETVEALLVSEAATDSLFVLQGERCWRLITDAEEAIAAPLLDAMEPAEPIYYTAGSMLGNQNLALLPLAGLGDLEEVTSRSEAASDFERSGREMAEAIFGENFDFVRRITDSFGNITYMYGYGEKTLTCLAEGRFEYRKSDASGPDPGFYGSLQAAISFAAQCGGWGSDRRELGFLLCGALQEGSGRNRVYTFDFAQVLDGIPVMSEDGPAVTIRVCGGEVSYYRRSVIEASPHHGRMRQTVDAANVLAGNCHLISSLLGGTVLSASSEEEFSFVAEQFRDASVAYVTSEDSLQPAWVITMNGGRQFFFGLYDASPLGFTRE